MPSSQPILEPADPGDAEALAALRDEAAAWLLEQGYVQWVPGEYDGSRFAQSIARDEVLVVRDHGRIVATVTLTTNDELVWADRHRPDASYLHRLIVARSRSGQGLGTTILREVERRAQARGHGVLRLDTVELNADLAAYYERHGFRAVGRREYPRHFGFHPSLLMEKIVTDGI